MTDSVKLWAFSDKRRGIELVPRVAPHEVDVGARARIAPLRHLEPALPSPAHVAGPACRGEKIENIGAAEQADHLASLDDRHAPDALANQQPRRLVDASVLAISSIGVSSRKVITFRVITSLTGIIRFRAV